MEQLGYVKSQDGSPLYAVYHPTTFEASHALLPVVIAPPLFEERKSSYASLRRLAATLASAGHPVLRFDYRGSGESGGLSAVRRWRHLAEDLATARKTLSQLTGRRDSALLGLRLGGTLCLQESSRAGGEAVIALAPVVQGAMQVRLWKMRSKIRAELTGAGKECRGVIHEQKIAASDSLDFDGYEVNSKFFEDVAGIDLLRDLEQLSHPGLMLQISHRTDALPESTQLVKILGTHARLELLRMEPFWDKIDDAPVQALEDSVLKFLSGIL